MDDVFAFVATFKEFPPRSFPPSFNPANILESMMSGIKQRDTLKQSVDVDRLRENLNRLIQQQVQSAGARFRPRSPMTSSEFAQAVALMSESGDASPEPGRRPSVEPM